MGKKGGKFHLYVSQTKPGSKEAPGTQHFDLLHPLNLGATGSVLPWQISPSVEVWGPASMCQWQRGERWAGGQAVGRGVGATGPSPGAILTAVLGSAPQKALKEMFPIESGDINMEKRIIPHLPGEGQARGLRSEIEIAAAWAIPRQAELCRSLPHWCLLRFLFLLTGLEGKTPTRSEQWWRILPPLASLAEAAHPGDTSCSISCAPRLVRRVRLWGAGAEPSFSGAVTGMGFRASWQHGYFVRGSDAMCLQR